jgi:uncharacterized protein YxjI
MKQKFWSWGDDFTIKDEDGRNAFFIDGKAFSWGNKLSFQDMDGHELLYISQKLLSWKPTYELYYRGDLYAKVIKEFSWFKQKFKLDVPGPNDYTITGSFWNHEYFFERGGGTVATVSKEFWSWSDTYGIDIVRGEDDVIILATCVVIDLVCHDDDNDDDDD